MTPEEINAILLSVRVAAACVVITIVPGIAIGWLLARRRFPGHAALDAIVHLPLVLPPVVVGYALLLLFGRHGPLHGLFGDVAFTWKAAALASAVMGFPLMVRAVRLAIELVDTRLEAAARTLGASPVRAFLTVTIPLAMPGILTGAVLAFARSLGEFGATMTFAGNIEGETRTLPLALFQYTQVPDGDGPAMRLLIISVILSFFSLFVSELAARHVRKRARG